MEDIYVLCFGVGSIRIFREKLEQRLNILLKNLCWFVGTHFANAFMILSLLIIVQKRRYPEIIAPCLYAEDFNEK